MVGGRSRGYPVMVPEVLAGTVTEKNLKESTSSIFKRIDKPSTNFIMGDVLGVFLSSMQRKQ